MLKRPFQCRRREEDDQRQQLLGRRAGAGPSWQTQEDMEAASQQSVQNSKRSLEETFQTGAGILASMADQRERLKVLPASGPACACAAPPPRWLRGPSLLRAHRLLRWLAHALRAVQSAHRKALDVLNSLGLSDGLLRVIDRRQRLDRIITFGGMVRQAPSRPLQLADPRSPAQAAPAC